MSTIDALRDVHGWRTRVEDFVFPETERDRERRRIASLTLPFFLLALIGALIPLVQMFRMSLSTSAFKIVGLSFDSYVRILASIAAYIPVLGDGIAADPVYGVVWWNSIWFGTITTIGSVIIGIGIAHGLEKYDLPAEDLIVTLISFPISLPGIVAAFMMIVLFGSTGLITNVMTALFQVKPYQIALTGQPSGSTLAVMGLFLGYLYSMIPRAVFILRGTYAEVNTAAEEAARALGATPVEAFWYATLPQIRPGVTGAVILTFRTALAIFGTVLVLKALSVVTFRFSQELSVGFDLATASALGILYFLFSLVFTFVGLQFTSAEVAE